MMAYDTTRKLAGWFRTTSLPYTSRIPIDRQEDFISQVIESYVARYPKDENKKICVKMDRLEVEAYRS